MSEFTPEQEAALIELDDRITLACPEHGPMLKGEVLLTMTELLNPLGIIEATLPVCEPVKEVALSLLAYLILHHPEIITQNLDFTHDDAFNAQIKTLAELYVKLPREETSGERIH